DACVVKTSYITQHVKVQKIRTFQLSFAILQSWRGDIEGISSPNHETQQDGVSTHALACEVGCEPAKVLDESFVHSQHQCRRATNIGAHYKGFLEGLSSGGHSG